MDAQTHGVTTSLLELLIAAKNGRGDTNINTVSHPPDRPRIRAADWPEILVN
jgi:hypothetical protein